MSAHGRSKTGHNKSKWETSDFPIVCETCLGDNPYVRMTKADAVKECKICTRPFTTFRWRPGTEARYKKTEVCQTCAKLKNCCQTCLLDLQYGLPTQVRDAALQAASSSTSVVPVSDVNREYLADMAERQVASGQLPFAAAPANQLLERLARRTPYYERNRAHICSFFVKGTCNRGAECPFRHELPTDPESDLAHQNIKDRYHGNNDPVAKRMLARMENFAPVPPEDVTVTTLWVGGLTPLITEPDLQDIFYSFGEIRSIRVTPKANSAFVTFATRAAAEAAVEALHHRLTVKGLPLKLNWGKPATLDPSARTQAGGFVGQAATYAGGGPAAPGGAPYYPSMDPSLLGARPARGGDD
jgi:pre-mRNA-splicing factor RBM22/SLT11